MREGGREKGRKGEREEGGRGRHMLHHCRYIHTHAHTHTHTHTRTYTRTYARTHTHTHRDRMNRLLTHLERSEAMVAITQEEKEKLKDKVRHVIATFE